MKSALVIMARYPRVGEVKTRLARTIGAVAAGELYGAFLRDLQRRFAGRSRPLLWAFWPPDSDFAALMPGTRCLPQNGADLGARMRDCFRRVLAEGFEAVVMIGADAPHVRDQWLDQAEAQLDEVDMVLGPSADGGYYLIAMRAPHDVFTGIGLSHPAVLDRTVEKAAGLGLRVHLLPPSFDVDEKTDLIRLQAVLRDPAQRRQLPDTAAVLARIAAG